MDDKPIKYEVDDRIATITLNRPDNLNALNVELLKQLDEAMAMACDSDDVWVIVLVGAGDRAFSVGGDLREYIPRITTEGLSILVSDPSQRFFSKVYKPIIAGVRGHCLAGGTEIVLGTDIRIASNRATFGLPEVRWGLVPAGGSHVRLSRQIPWAVAMEMLLTGKEIDARRAYEVGLVNYVVPDEEVIEKSTAIAAGLCENGPLALRTAKEIAVRSQELESPFVMEYGLANRVFSSEDAREGPKAFVEKRRPVFRGR